MIKISFTYDPPDTDKWVFEFSCPFCRLKTPLTFGQVRREEYFICRGCHATIKAIDQLGGIQKIKYTFKNLFK